MIIYNCEYAMYAHISFIKDKFVKNIASLFFHNFIKGNYLIIIIFIKGGSNFLTF